MAERLSKKNKANGTSDVGIVPPETVLEARREITQSKEALEEAQTAHRNLCKRWKGKGLNIKALIEVIQLRRQEPATVVAHFHDVVRYAKIEKAEFAEQLNLFGQVQNTEPSGAAREQHAEFTVAEAGYMAGRRGFGQDACPHLQGSRAHQVWATNWKRGQAHIAKQLGKNAKVATAAPRKRGTGSSGPRAGRVASALAGAQAHLGTGDPPPAEPTPTPTPAPAPQRKRRAAEATEQAPTLLQ
jgi:hypothetical protein